MKIFRKTEFDTDGFMIGDQINCGFGLATCQKVSEEGALFFTDDYDNEVMERKQLVLYLNSEEGLEGFASEVRDRLVPFNNIFVGKEDGNNFLFLMQALVRLPYAGEMFPKDETDFLEEDDCEQLPLMKERRNRIAVCQDDWEWGWLMNRSKRYAALFGYVGTDGYVGDGSASNAGGVRRAFLISDL